MIVAFSSARHSLVWLMIGDIYLIFDLSYEIFQYIISMCVLNSDVRKTEIRFRFGF